MNRILLALGLLVADQSFAITVRDADIHGKTSLATTSVRTVNGKQMTILVDQDGFSLYTFQKDGSNKSNCNGGCLTVWPPQHVPLGSRVEAPFAIIQGGDGQPQLTLEGRPLYHYDDDKKPGDAFGQYPQWDVIEVTN